jgi:hypothetical protein
VPYIAHNVASIKDKHFEKCNAHLWMLVGITFFEMFGLVFFPCDVFFPMNIARRKF